MRRRVEDDASALAELVNLLKRPVEMGGRLDVYGDAVGARVREVGNVPLGLLDHEVYVHVELRGRADGFDDERTDRDVRDEPPVHDVDVNPVGARTLHGLHLVRKAAEVGG